jgi:hypothetical protein
MNRPGVVFSREQLLNAVWGQDRAITDRAVDVYVLRLRQKVEQDPASPILIHSVRGFGYTFEPRRAMATAWMRILPQRRKDAEKNKTRERGGGGGNAGLGQRGCEPLWGRMAACAAVANRRLSGQPWPKDRPAIRLAAP